LIGLNQAESGRQSRIEAGARPSWRLLALRYAALQLLRANGVEIKECEKNAAQFFTERHFRISGPTYCAMRMTVKDISLQGTCAPILLLRHTPAMPYAMNAADISAPTAKPLPARGIAIANSSVISMIALPGS
jgi:hypothetical protein